MSVKELAIESLEQLPDNVNWSDVQERINFMAGIQKALGEVEAGEGIPIEELEAEVKQWFAR